MLGSHYSWSFLKPVHFYHRLINFAYRCQCLSIQQQYLAGIRVFDLHVRFVNDLGYASPHVFYGLIDYGDRPFEDLDWLARQADDVYVRLILECNHKLKNQKLQDENFVSFIHCLTISISRLRPIHFFGFYRKYDCFSFLDNNLRNWFNTFNYVYKEPPALLHFYASMDNSSLRDYLDYPLSLWPWFYAHLFNKDTIKDFLSNSKINPLKLTLFYDFVKPSNQSPQC